jgi:hypothetical protein
VFFVREAALRTEAPRNLVEAGKPNTFQLKSTKKSPGRTEVEVSQSMTCEVTKKGDSLVKVTCSIAQLKITFQKNKDNEKFSIQQYMDMPELPELAKATTTIFGNDYECRITANPMKGDSSTQAKVSPANSNDNPDVSTDHVKYLPTQSLPSTSVEIPLQASGAN